MAILYKCRLSNLQKGGRPCYQAIVQSSGTISRAEFIDELVRLSGNSPQVAEFFLNLMVAVLEHFYRQGKRIQLGSLAGGIAIRGSVSSPTKSWEQSGMKLVPYLDVAGSLKNCLADEKGRNVTQGTSASITGVLDTVHAINWSIIGTVNVIVHAIGLGLAVDSTAEDEGAWLENSKGEIVAMGEVTAATDMTLDCTFTELPESGRYKFVVATRNGLGPEYGVALAKRWVTVQKEDANG